MSIWNVLSNLAWAASAAIAIWLIYDWLKTDRSYSESQLTSSREGEIEAVSEKHKAV
jgi:hypothetical protein